MTLHLFNPPELHRFKIIARPRELHSGGPRFSFVEAESAEAAKRMVEYNIEAAGYYVSAIERVERP